MNGKLSFQSIKLGTRQPDSIWLDVKGQINYWIKNQTDLYKLVPCGIPPDGSETADKGG
jgi:hypothetical protein